MTERKQYRPVHYGNRPAEPAAALPVASSLHWIGASCMSRREWEAALIVLLNVELYGDPLTGAPAAARELKEELFRGPWAPVMAAAA